MTLVPSQVILGVALLGLVLYAFRLRTVLVDRLIYALLALTGLVLVIHPSLSTDIANRLGVGRGADLLLYTLVMLSLFRDLGVASELKQIERRLTLLVRASALEAPVRTSRRLDHPGADADDARGAE